ncbi:hypothetical protein CLI91_10470 [Lentilactobacillus hilgardii]|nr:hypothetical protein [Lentilactobacillus hilgardii]MBZ2204694.1 hypothetical protein [Lentilactobacillus hilgardii]
MDNEFKNCYSFIDTSRGIILREDFIMLDVKKSLDRLTWNTQHHYAHIEAQHDFIRAWAVQFEMGYTDFRVVQMSLQLDGGQHELLARFAAAYEKVYDYEYAFAAGGLEGFNQQYGDKIADYKQAADDLLKIIDEIRAINGAVK